MADRSLLTRLKQRARYEITMRGFDAVHGLGLGGRALRNRPGGRILLYHGLDRRGGSGFNARFTAVHDFERQVEWMAARFRIVSLDEYFAGVRDPHRFTVALTFDDGYATSLDLALPVLERHGVKATFFVTAIRAAGEEVLWPDRLDIAMFLHRTSIQVRGEGFERRARQGGFFSIRDGSSLKARCKQANWAFIQEALAAFPPEVTRSLPEDLAAYWRTIDAAGLRRLSQSPLVTIGSHGVRHVTLPCQDTDVARAEMLDSKLWLEEVTGREVSALAFPNGAWTSELLTLAEEIGYRQLFGGDGESSFRHGSMRGRLTMNPFISWPNQVRCLYSGGYP